MYSQARCHNAVHALRQFGLHGVSALFTFKGGEYACPRSRHPRWRDASEPVQEMRTFRIFLGDKRLHIVASKMIWPKRIAPLLKEICNFDDFRIACQFWRCK